MTFGHVEGPDYDSRWEEGGPTVAEEAAWNEIPEHKQFVEDMRDADLEVYEYAGRFWWKGPAVTVDSLQEAMSETKVKVQYDQMGLGYVVYPVVSR
jgi:hypothetical protein